MNIHELQWLKYLYERHVLYEHKPEILVESKSALNCIHWAYLIYHSIEAKNKVIKRNKDHTVCVINKIHIDLECNAFIKAFDWDNGYSLENATLAPINASFPIKHHLLHRFYRSKCEYIIKIDSHLNILS
jgi:hypothetical protein